MLSGCAVADPCGGESCGKHALIRPAGALSPQTGKVKEEAKLHEKEIKDMQLYRDGTHLVTASTDKQVKLVDTQTLEVLKIFNTDRPANAAALSPIFDQARAHLACFLDGQLVGCAMHRRAPLWRDVHSIMQRRTTCRSILLLASAS